MEPEDEKNTKATADAHRAFAIVCVTYLSFRDFDSGFCQTHAAFQERLQSNQLYNYAAHNWGHHAREASTYCPSVMKFLRDSLKVKASSQALMATKRLWYSNWSRQVPKRVTGLHLAAYFGIQETVDKLLQEEQNIDQEDDECRTPLSYAAENGHEAIVKLLLRKKANVNEKGGKYGNALRAALFQGHERIVEMLVEKGADVNAQGGKYDNALQAASYRGYESIVEMLLTKKANVNAQGGKHGNALQAASYGGHESIVKMLLTKKANVNAQGGKYGNALQAASYQGHWRIAKMLLEKDADINAQGGEYGNALQAAVDGGYEKTVKMLLKDGASVNVQGGKRGNALRAKVATDESLRTLESRGFDKPYLDSSRIDGADAVSDAGSADGDARDDCMSDAILVRDDTRSDRQRAHRVFEGSPIADSDPSTDESDRAKRPRLHYSAVPKARINIVRELSVGLIVNADLPFSIFTNPYFEQLVWQLVWQLDPHIAGQVPWSRQSMSRHLNDVYHATKSVVEQEPSHVLTKIHLGFDLWTSPNRYAIMAVTAHLLIGKGAIRCACLHYVVSWDAT
ncbi:hypothetical protein MY5147_009347, partial [Beauveria neobassiana]